MVVNCFLAFWRVLKLESVTERAELVCTQSCLSDRRRPSRRGGLSRRQSDAVKYFRLLLSLIIYLTLVSLSSITITLVSLPITLVSLPSVAPPPR